MRECQLKGGRKGWSRHPFLRVEIYQNESKQKEKTLKSDDFRVFDRFLLPKKFSFSAC